MKLSSDLKHVLYPCAANSEGLGIPLSSIGPKNSQGLTGVKATPITLQIQERVG